MRKSAVLILLLLVTCSVMATTAHAEGVTREQLDEAITKLVANGELWAKDETIPAAQKANLKGLKFDKASAPVAGVALRGIARTPAGMYATARLLEHLQGSDVETLQVILRDVQIAQSRARSSYRPFPAISKSVSASLAMPDYNPSLTTDAIMARMASLAERRAEKKDREVLIAKQNEAAWDIEQAAFSIQALAGTRSDDARAASAMMMAERADDATFIAIADAYIAAAPKMDADRASRLYQTLRPYAARLRLANRKNYICKGKCVLSDQATSTFTPIPDYPGIKLVTLMNKLVPVAKDKRCVQIPVPTAAEIKTANTPKKGK